MELILRLLNSLKIRALISLGTDTEKLTLLQDPVALKEMYEAQKQMEQWAVSKNKPGQFLGSTGARVLPKHEFNTGIQAYAKKEQFTKAERVSLYLTFCLPVKF